jgi:predicted enzyme related to lactoylglutathione lyase
MKKNSLTSKACRVLPRLLLVLGCLAGTQAFSAPPPPLELPPLAGEGQQLPGKFVWADLVTNDVAAAQKFYGKLFGWTFRDVGHYTIASTGDRPVAGLLQRALPKDRPAQPRWISYISVPDVAATQSAVTAAGGKVLLPLKMYAKRGEQAVFADAEGAMFAVMKSSSGDPADYQPEIGEWSWFQLLSRDAEKASAFYRAVGGYELKVSTINNQVDSVLLTSQDQFRAAVRTIPANHPDLKPTWLPFLRVQSVKDSVALTTQLGGKVLLAPSHELFEGKVAVIADPTGGAIGLLESTDEAQNGGTK